MIGTSSGALLRRGDKGYESARRSALINKHVPARFPDLIAAPVTEAQLVALVDQARIERWRIATRSGGHSWCGAPLRDGGVLIDMSSFNDIVVDRAAMTASFGPAVTATRLSTALAAQELAFPTGHCPTVGMGGYLLAGGRGWNWGQWGPACFSLRSADVVTAAGERLTADRDHHPEILWAVRGAGPCFFGIVTRFHVDVYPMPKSIGTGVDVYPAELCDDVMTWVRKLQAESLGEIRVSLASGFDLLGRDEPILTVSSSAFTNSQRDTAAVLDELDGCPVRRSALFSSRNVNHTFDDLFATRASRYPEEYRWAADTVLSSRNPVDCVRDLAREVARAPSRLSHVLFALPRELMRPAPPPGAAFSVDGMFDIHVYTGWSDVRDDDANTRWVEGIMATLEPTSIGHYIGEANLTRCAPDHCFSAANWRRLGELRRKYDPTGLFHDPLGSQRA